MTVTLLDLRDAVDRRLGNFVMSEASTDTGDGEAAVFELSHQNIIPTSLIVSVDATTTGEVVAGTLDEESATYTFNLVPIAEAEIIFQYQYKHWSTAQVTDAINGAVNDLFGRFYEEGESTVTSTGVQEYQVYDSDDTALTHEDRITRVEYWSSPHWVRIDGWNVRNTAGLKYVHFETAPSSGYSLRVSYIKQPRPFSGTDDTETLASIGLPDRAKEPLVLYAASELIAMRIGPRIRDDRANNTQNENAIKSYEMVNDSQFLRAQAELKASRIRMAPWSARVRY